MLCWRLRGAAGYIVCTRDWYANGLKVTVTFKLGGAIVASRGYEQHSIAVQDAYLRSSCISEYYMLVVSLSIYAIQLIYFA